MSRPTSSDVAVLTQSPLFNGASSKEIDAMLGCLGAVKRSYAKDEYIYHRGDNIASMGLVLSGSVRLESGDPWGNVSVLGRVGQGRVFAETYAAVPDEPLMVDVVAMENTDVLFLNVARVMTTCSSACAHHQAIVRNMLTIFARKNLGLSQRVFMVAPKTIRGKLLAYLAFQASYQGSDEFDIPFNRQQLADYLGVDRSAMSAELSTMKSEGILDTKRSHFVLLNV